MKKRTTQKQEKEKTKKKHKGNPHPKDLNGSNLGMDNLEG